MNQACVVTFQSVLGTQCLPSKPLMTVLITQLPGLEGAQLASWDHRTLHPNVPIPTRPVQMLLFAPSAVRRPRGSVPMISPKGICVQKAP